MQESSPGFTHVPRSGSANLKSARRGGEKLMLCSLLISRYYCCISPGTVAFCAREPIPERLSEVDTYSAVHSLYYTAVPGLDSLFPEARTPRPPKPSELNIFHAEDGGWASFPQISAVEGRKECFSTARNAPKTKKESPLLMLFD